MRVLAAERGDLGEIAWLAGVTWRAHYPGIISPGQIEYMLERIYREEELARELAAGTVYLRLVEEGDGLAGFASYGPPLPGGDCKLHKLYVHPERQRRGHGRRLVEEVAQRAAAGGSRHLVLTVNKRNEQALRAYEKYGFSRRAEVVVEIGGGFVMDDYVMSKALDPIEEKKGNRR
jgi:diamine N-acetyltransferase